jgi:hypothetical protein
MAWVTYTTIRLALVVVIWFAIQFLTSVRGLLALALALLISAIFSIIFLGKQRDAMSQSIFGFFRRLNERIDAAAAKEDYLEVNQQDVPGSFEDGDQGGPAGPAKH